MELNNKRVLTTAQVSTSYIDPSSNARIGKKKTQLPFGDALNPIHENGDDSGLVNGVGFTTLSILHDIGYLISTILHIQYIHQDGLIRATVKTGIIHPFRRMIINPFIGISEMTGSSLADSLAGTVLAWLHWLSRFNLWSLWLNSGGHSRMGLLDVDNGYLLTFSTRNTPFLQESTIFLGWPEGKIPGEVPCWILSGFQPPELVSENGHRDDDDDDGDDDDGRRRRK